MGLSKIVSLKTFLLLFTWTIIDSAPFLLTQQYEGWSRYLNLLQSPNKAQNLLSNCPWEYVYSPGGRIGHRVQIFPFAKYHCVDLMNSRTDRPAYIQGSQCQPLRTPVYGCGGVADQSVIVGFYCVYNPNIFANKRNSDKNQTHTELASTYETVKHTMSPVSSTTNSAQEKPENKGENMKEETPDTSDHDQGGQEPLHPFMVPPFLNGAMQQLNRTPIFLQNYAPGGPPDIFMGNHNPQLGMPPLERPMTLMDLFKGRSRAENVEPENLNES